MLASPYSERAQRRPQGVIAGQVFGIPAIAVPQLQTLKHLSGGLSLRLRQMVSSWIQMPRG